jgi:DNA-binding MarR family transcriptional regulator
MMARTEDPRVPEGVRAVTMGVWHLILNGERFRQLKAAELQLGPSHIVALGHLYQDGPMTPRDLADTLDMTSGTVTALLDRVEKAGFLVRSTNPGDRRSLLITATPAGRHAVEWLYEEFDGAIRHAMAGTPDTAAGGIGSFLQLLGDALETVTARKPRPAKPGHPERNRDQGE